MTSALFDPDRIPDDLFPYKEKLSPRFFEVRKNVINFIQEDVIPATSLYKRQYAENQAKAEHPLLAPQPAILKDLRQRAKDRNLWNFFLPEVSGLTVLEYAPIAELLGAVKLANIAMNCSAPDTGNMEVLEKYGTPYQKKKWLEPLLNAEIRSSFAMTEPGVASSDATNISTRIERKGDNYVINGHKWWISGTYRPECKVMIVLGKTRFDGPRHTRQSMIIVPKDTPGVKLLRPLSVFGHTHDHAEIVFDNVVVPKENMILGEGRGFEIAQGRLGPGRIHHCMRTIGVAEMAMASIMYRIHTRKAFGGLLSDKDNIRRIIAESRMEITKCRGLCYLAACMADELGFKGARKYIAMIKVAAPLMAQKIIDEAMQIHGAHGLGPDSKLTALFTGIRTLRVADGPDIVHLNTIAKGELNAWKNKENKLGRYISGINKNVEKFGKFDHVKGDLYMPNPKPKSKL